MSAFKAAAITLAIVLLASTAQAQSLVEPRFVNKFLGDFSTPSIVPGGSGTFSLTVNHPDPANLTLPMQNVLLDVSIYQYATLDETLMVSDMLSPPLIISTGAPAMTADCGNIQPGGEFTVSFDISTERSTPHGSYFSQSTYFVRFILDFTYGGVNYSFASRGYFDDDQWTHLTETETGAGEINQTYLAELGYDGIIPDSAFSVKIPIPRWPFYVLVGLTAFTGLLAFSFYVLDNPGRYPGLELKLLRLNGRFNLHWRGIMKRFKK